MRAIIYASTSLRSGVLERMRVYMRVSRETGMMLEMLFSNDTLGSFVDSLVIAGIM